MNANIITQIISLVLWVFAFAGLQINPEQVASDTYTAVKTANWPLITIVLVNLATTFYKWYQTWQTNKPNFLLFLRSPNWIASALNIAFAIAATYGIVIPSDAAQVIVQHAFAGEWYHLAGYLLPSLLAPIVAFLTKDNVAAQKALLEKAKRI